MTKGTLGVFFVIVAVLVAGCFNNSTDSKTSDDAEPFVMSFVDDKAEIQRMPKHTQLLAVSSMGMNDPATRMLIISVAPEHKDWLVHQLTLNKGVSRFNDLSATKSGSVIHDYRYHVYLTDRIGQDDFDKLVDLPRRLDEHIDPQD